MNKFLFFVAERTAEQYAKPHKPDREEQIPHGLSHVCDPEQMNSQKQRRKWWLKRLERGGVRRRLGKKGRNMLMLFLILSSVTQHDEYS